MKTFLWIVLVVVFGGLEYQAIAQIPNAGFESWTDSLPNSWNTSNSFFANIIQTSSSHSGSSAVHGVVADIGGGFAWPPVLISGTDAEGFPVNTQYPALHGWYKLTPSAGDMFLLSVGMNHADSAVGAGGLSLPTAQAVYREFVANIFYAYPQAPDTCIIYMSLIGPGGLPHIGSTFDVDDLAFGPAVAVDEHGNAVPATFRLSQNYPNPFNPTTRIEYSLPRESQVHLSVYTMLGQEVSVLVNERQTAGVYRAEFNGAHLASGTYFYRLQAGEFLQVRKLQLVK